MVSVIIPTWNEAAGIGALHADTYPPPGFQEQLEQAVRKGSGSGCYRLQFCYYLIYTLYKLKLSQKYLVRFYHWLLRKQ